MATKVGSSSRLQSTFVHEKPIDVKRPTRCKARKPSKDDVSTNDIMKIFTQVCEQTACGGLLASKAQRGPQRPAPADEMIAAAAAAAALTPKQSPLKRLPRTSTTPAASLSGLNFRSSSLNTAKKPQACERHSEIITGSQVPSIFPAPDRYFKMSPVKQHYIQEPKSGFEADVTESPTKIRSHDSPNECCSPREDVSIHRRCCDLSEDDMGKNRKTSSNKIFPVELVESRETGRARSRSSVTRHNIAGSCSPTNIKTHCDVSKTTIEQNNMPRDTLQTHPSRRHIRTMGRNGETVWNPLVPANMVTVPAERPDAVADAAGDAESRAARNFNAQEPNSRAPGRRMRGGPEGPPTPVSLPPPPSSRTSEHRGGRSPSRHRPSRSRRDEHRDERGWKPWPLQGMITPVVDLTHNKSSSFRRSRESSPFKSSRRKKSRQVIMETKYLEVSSRDSSPRKDTSKPRTTSRGRGGGTCIVASSVWGGSCDGCRGRRKASRKSSTHSGNKKRRSPETPSPSRAGSRQTVIDDMCGYVSTRHLREHLEAWEDLVVEKGHRRSGSKTTRRAKSKKQRAEKVDSQTEIPTKKTEKPEKSILKKEKASFHSKQVSKENIDKDSVQARFSDKRKTKDVSKTTVNSEAPSVQRAKKHRQKATSEPPSRYKSPAKIKDKEEARDSSNRSGSQSSDESENEIKDSRGRLFASQTKEKLDIAEISTSLPAPKTFIALADKISLGNTQTELKSTEKWPMTLLDTATSGKLTEGLWAPVTSDHSIGNDLRVGTHLTASRSTCQGGSGDEVIPPRKLSSVCTVCSRLSTDTADSPNRALTPGLTVQERLELECGHDILVYNTTEQNVRVRSSINPRSSEETGYSTRSRSVSAGTSLSRNRHKKLVRKRRGAALACVRCPDSPTRPHRSHQGYVLRSDIPAKLSPFAPRPRKTSPNAMVTWERAHHLSTNRGNVSKDRRTRKTNKFKSVIANQPKRAMAGPQHAAAEEHDRCVRDLDWKLDFAMEAALRVAGLRESDSQADSSPTVPSSQENDSQASKDDYAESKDSTWSPFVRRPLSAVPEEDSHCSSSNKDNAKSEFDLELIFKHKQPEEDGDKVISAVLNQIFRDGSSEIIVSEYERTLTDSADRFGLSPSSPTMAPHSSDSASRWRTKTDFSSTEHTLLAPTDIGSGFNATTSTLTLDFPFSTDLETRSDDNPSTLGSNNTVTKIENGEKYDVTRSSLKSIFVNHDTSFLEVSSTEKEISLGLISYSTLENSENNLDSFSKNDSANQDAMNSRNLAADSRDTNNKKDATDERLEDKERCEGEVNISRTKSKPGVFIALDTLLMQYEESYSTSSADVMLDPNLPTLKSSQEDTKRETTSSHSSSSDSDQMSDNTYENIKSLSKYVEHPDNFTDITENNAEPSPFLTEAREISKDIMSSDDSLSLKTESNSSVHQSSMEDIKDASSHSSVSANKKLTSLNSQEKEVQKETPILLPNSNTREENQNVLEEALHASVISQVPLIRDVNTLPSMKDVMAIPDRFVVQEGGTFKEPSTPFKFVLTVNLHGPTALDSSVEGSEDFDGDSLSSRCTRCRSGENAVNLTSRNIEDDVKREDPTIVVDKDVTTKDVADESVSNAIFDNTKTVKVDAEEKPDMSVLPCFPGESEVSDSDNLSTIPSVFNLEEIDDDRCGLNEKELLVSKPNTEIIECISSVCKHWRNSIESLCDFEDDLTCSYISQRDKLVDTFQQNNAQPFPSASNASVHNQSEDGRSSNHATDAEWKWFAVQHPKQKRRVALKLFSDWDALNHLVDFSDRGNLVNAYLSKERMEDILSTASSCVRSFTNTSVSVKGSLKRKRESKSTETRDLIDRLTEIFHASTEENSPVSSLSALPSQSEDTSKDFPLFHYLPRPFRKEIARDRETILGQENMISKMMICDTSMSDDQVSENSHPSENYKSVFSPINEQVDTLFGFPIDHENTLNNCVIECYKREIFREFENASLREEMSQEDLFVMADCTENSESEFDQMEQYDSTHEDFPQSEENLEVVYENKNSSPDDRYSDNTLVNENYLSKYLNTAEEVNQVDTYCPRIENEEKIQENPEQSHSIAIENLAFSGVCSDSGTNTSPNWQEPSREVVSTDIFYSAQRIHQNISNQAMEEYEPTICLDGSEDEKYKQGSITEAPLPCILGERSVDDINHNQIDRVILEGVALTVLLDAAAVITRFLKTVDLAPERKLQSPAIEHLDRNIPLEAEISFKSLPTIESQANHMDLTLKDLIYHQDTTQDSMYVAPNISERTVAPSIQESSLDSIDSVTMVESSVLSGEETSMFTSGSDSVDVRGGTVVLIPTDSSRNLSMYIQNPAWESVSYSQTDSGSDAKSEPSVTQGIARVVAGFLSPMGMSTERLTVERATSTMSNNSEWETISPSGSNEEESNSKVLESLWRRDSRQRAVNWDTSNETLGLVDPLASFASPPSAPAMTRRVSLPGGSGDGMQLVFMRPDVRFTESEDSTERCSTWERCSETPPDSRDTCDAATMSVSPPPSRDRKSEAVQVSLTPSESGSPKDNISTAIVWGDDGRRLRILESSKPVILDNEGDANHDQMEKTKSMTLPACQKENTVETLEKSTSKNSLQFSESDFGSMDEPLITAAEESAWSSTRTKNREAVNRKIESMFDLDYESSLDTESESDSMESVEMMRRIEDHSWPERDLTEAWPFSRTASFSRSPLLLETHHMTLGESEKSSDCKERPDFTNNVIAVLCLVFAVVVMNSILAANNIIIFK